MLRCGSSYPGGLIGRTGLATCGPRRLTGPLIQTCQRERRTTQSVKSRLVTELNGREVYPHSLAQKDTERCCEHLDHNDKNNRGLFGVPVVVFVFCLHYSVSKRCTLTVCGHVSFNLSFLYYFPVVVMVHT